ncbi:hypothetical protein HYW20_00200 [Candidatus Woesearchaeota archaeon]|nr:hypothetical protein [Candidatus Woesearchaeota archaeon]
MQKSIKLDDQFDSAVLNIALDTLKIGKQALIFASTKKSAEKTAEEISKKIKTENDVLKALADDALNALSRPTKQCERLAFCLKKGIAFHHAGLTQHQKNIIEDNFRNGTIKLICCTPTLCLSKDTKLWHGIDETEVSTFETSNPIFVISNNKLISMKTQKIQKVKNSSKLIQISSVSGYSIKVTPNHKMYIKRNNKKVIISADKIKIKDKIATIGYLNINEKSVPKISDLVKDNDIPVNINFSQSISYLIGAMLGDGYSGAQTSNGKIIYKGSPSIVGKDKEIFFKVMSTCRELGISYRISKTFHGTPQLVLGKNKWFREFLCSCGVEKGENKYISALIMNSEGDLVAELLRGLFDTDGFVQKHTKNIGFCSISYRLIKNVQKLLLRFGIVCTIRKKEKRIMKIYDKEYATKPIYELLINQKICIERFHKKIGFSVKRKQEALKNVLKGFNLNIHYISCNKCNYKLYKDLFGGRTNEQKEWGKRKPEVIKLVGENNELGSREINQILSHEPRKKEIRLNHHYQLISKKRMGSRSNTEWYWSLNNIGKWVHSSLLNNNFNDIFRLNNCPICDTKLTIFIKKSWRSSDFEGDIFWDMVKEIKILDYEEDVYDVVLPNSPFNSHMFVAEGFIVHNSYGVDLPAYRAIIKDLKRYTIHGLTWIPVLDYMQMSGRAGRPRYDNEGQSIAIALTNSEKEKIEEKYVNGTPEDIYSKLAVEPVLRTYVLSLIAANFTTTKKQLFDFFDKTFYAHQFKDLRRLHATISKVIGMLDEWEFIMRSGDEFASADEIDDEKLKPTLMGRRIAELYIDPLTANFIIKCLQNASDKRIESFSFLQMVSHTLEIRPMLKVGIREYDKIQESMLQFSTLLLENEPSMYEPEYEDFLNSVKTALMLNHWISEQDEEFLLEEYNIRPGELRMKLEIADWLLYATEEISRIMHYQSLIKEIVKLRLRLKYGIKEELLPLVRLENIGRVRARLLFRNRMRDIKDLKSADLSTLTKLLGDKVALSLKKQLGQEQTEVPENKRKGQISLKDWGE